MKQRKLPSQEAKTWDSLESYKKDHPNINIMPRTQQDRVRFAEEATKKSVQIEKGTQRER